MQSNTLAELPNFQRIFESVPGAYLILKPDPPHFTIIAMSDAYAVITNTVREQILGKGLFEVFPDNPNESNATGVKNLTASLHRVLEHKAMDKMATQKYDMRRSASMGGEFEERYWEPENTTEFELP